MAVKGALPRRHWDVMQVFLDHDWDIDSPVEPNVCLVLKHVPLRFYDPSLEENGC
jgi:hypothetical protein